MIQRQLKERRGQKQFRDAIIKRYGSKCMVTGCKIPDILEAAHINPYKGEKDNHPANGLLLRADIHTLFDLDLIGIHPTSFAVSFHKKCTGQILYITK
ncbi:MAG: HNH endonuclease signature motif containing protein [Bacteroidota bacterium]